TMTESYLKPMIISIKPWLELAENGGMALSSIPDEQQQLANEGLGGYGSNYSMSGDRSKFYHQPIMLSEVVEALKPEMGKQILDGTLGGGGHTELLLQMGAHVIGCDQDTQALDFASERLEAFGDRFLPLQGNFENMDSLLEEVGIDQLDGILLDIGVSSRQLDDPARGFSFRGNGPLDMRMDQGGEVTAATVVNTYDEAELTRIFKEYGEEKRARAVARKIVEVRENSPIETTEQLSDLVATVIRKTSAKNPATKVFQALRIEVNRELEVLENALSKAINLLGEGGVLAVITFHSLEDRIVKRFLRKHSQPFIDQPNWPEPKSNPDFCLNLVNRKALIPADDEIELNSRARSAKLRVAVKV
ncbi:MAG: 16S rRNA (cytosine(1402)-N(4))-methyltransferase RsmH, partial [Verrucomicrobiota bacterium]